MLDQPISPISRRGLLRMGLVASAGIVAGCSEGGLNQVEKPPVQAAGTRKRLDTFKGTAEEVLAKKKQR
jgi:hypothetical protein